jgi:putative nucleotide binding protein
MRAEKKENQALAIDVLSHGYPDDPRPIIKREPVVQAIGVDQFKLLEIIPKVRDIEIHELLYIGDGERQKVERVKRRLKYSELTATAKLELPYAIEKIVKEDEERFVEIFNTSVPISLKLHMLHLLPGIGKKLLSEVLDARQKSPFASFDDIRTRIKSIPHPERMIIDRIVEEIMDPDVKYHLFTSR